MNDKPTHESAGPATAAALETETDASAPPLDDFDPEESAAESGPGDEIEMEVFRAGDYGPKGVYGVEDLEAIAREYDPEFHEAPLTLDHAQEGPRQRLGRVRSALGDRLVARLKGLSRDVREAIASGAYKKPSVELYLPGPDREKPALKAVTLLGAGVPEVKGLAAPAFSELPEGVAALSASGLRRAEFAGPRTAAAPPRPAPDAAGAVERLRRQGKYLPAWDRAGLPAFMDRLASMENAFAESAASFGEESESAAAFGESAVDWLAEFLESLAGVHFGALADPPVPAALRHGLGGHRPRLPRESARTPVSAESVQLHRAASRFLASDPALGYSEALRLAASERPAAGF